ncbi:MAG TPA: class I SAM-dependent methyltransferase [Flavitalea sp.]|nr:class I SAM-dependent methyltransferase [Flavitalea sp.]
MAIQKELIQALAQSDAFAEMLENRMKGFWNTDYFEKIVLPQLDLKADDKVLDVGAGNGALTLLLARYFPDVHFTGIDITPALVEDGKKLTQKLDVQNVEFEVGDALQLPFADRSFDATVCQTVLMHVSNPAKAVSEMSRVLKQGGTFMAAEYHMLTYDKLVESAGHTYSLEEEIAIGRYIQYYINGYRTSGHGDLKIGARVPFFAVNAGLNIVDVRMNDRVPHAFPPYEHPSDRISLKDLQTWAKVIKDPSYRALLTATIVEGGGTEEDATALLALFPSHSSEVFNSKVDFAFVWVLNPVLLITVARKK